MGHEKEREEGVALGKRAMAKSLINVLEDSIIAEKTGLSMASIEV